MVYGIQLHAVMRIVMNLLVNMVLDDSYDEIANMNGDGIINILDIITLINTILS